MFAIRLIGNSWYINHDRSAIATTTDLNDGRVRLYKGRFEAQTAAVVLTAAWPNWIQKVKIVRVRSVRRHKVIADRDPETKALKSIRCIQTDHIVTA